MSIFDMLRGGKNPADYARQYLEPVPGYGHDAYDPFVSQGKSAYGALEPEYMRMLQDPRGMYNEDMGGYETSGEYNYKLPFLQREAKNAALSGGHLGTETDERRRMEMINALLNSDMGSYLDRIQGYRSQGMQGLEGATNRGFQSSGSLADFLGASAGNRANLEFAGKSQQEQNKMELMNALMKLGFSGMGAKSGTQAPTTPTYGAADRARAQRTAQTELSPFGNSYGGRRG